MAEGYSFIVVVDFVTSIIASDLEGWKIPVSPLFFHSSPGGRLAFSEIYPRNNPLVWGIKDGRKRFIVSDEKQMQRL